MDFKSITDLIENKKFEEAESNLETSLNVKDIDPKVVAKIQYLIGFINQDYNYNRRSKIKAKRYFGYVLDSNYPNEMSFYYYAQLEKDKNVSKNILHKGLTLFPKSEKLYEYLISISDNNEQENIFNEINAKEIVSYSLSAKEIIMLYDLEIYESIEEKCMKIIKHFELSEQEIQSLKLISCFSILLSNKENRYSETELIIQDIILADAKNNLGYKPLIALIIYYYKINNLTEVIKIIDKIPAGFMIEDFYDTPWFPIEINFQNTFENLFTNLLLSFKSNKIICTKIKSLRALYLYSAYRFWGIVRFNSHHTKDLEVALKYFPDQPNIYISLYDINIEKKDYIKAFLIYMESLKQYFDETQIFYSTCINEPNDIVFEQILQEFKIRINQTINTSMMCKTIFNPIIKRLFKEKRYEVITEITTLINSLFLEDNNCLFEIAYSYKMVNDVEKSKMLYIKIINQGKASSAVYNNIGVLYEEAGDLFNAKDLYIKSCSLNKDDEISKKNLKRLKQKEIKEINSKITLPKLQQIGFDDELFLSISNIKNSELSDIIKRDLQENAIALTTGLYKLSMIMSGSIIEAILINKLLENGIIEYKPENGNKRKIEELDLIQLIDVAEQNKLIKSDQYHFSNAIRQYRNLVHPGKEIRTMSNSVNEDNASLMWNVLKKLIKEI